MGGPKVVPKFVSGYVEGTFSDKSSGQAVTEETIFTSDSKPSSPSDIQILSARQKVSNVVSLREEIGVPMLFELI